MAATDTREEILPINSVSISVKVGVGSGVYHTAPVRNYHSSDQRSTALSDEREEPEIKPVQRRRQWYYRQKGKSHEHLTYFCALSVASYIGVLARIYLSQLATWNGVPFFPSLYPEIVGTAIMGLIGSHKLLLTNYKASYQAIATGLCGSITTFSSWNSEAMTVLLQVDADPPSNATRIIAWGTIIFLGLGMPIAALLFGKHVASLSPWSDSELERRHTEPVTEETQTETQSRRTWCVAFEGISYVISWIVCTIIAVMLTYKLNEMDLMFSILFASLGTYIRWHLAPFNAAVTDFKLGTFLVNILGSWILGGITVAQIVVSERNDNRLVLSVLRGVATGFCGCLTTVSTFAVELTSLSLRGTYLYAVCSLIAAQVGLLVIRGTYEWTK